MMKLVTLYCFFVIILDLVPYSMSMSLKSAPENVRKTIANSEIQKELEFDPANFLIQFGYNVGVNKLKKPFVKGSKNENNLEDMVRLFQNKFGLKVTGKLDKNTIDLMSAPRCGYPDFIDENSDFKPTMVKNTNSKEPLSFEVINNWRKHNLTYRFLNHNADLGNQATELAFKIAFDYWSKNSSVKFLQVCQTCNSDMTILFAQGLHSGDSFGFDGPGGVLAHAFFPEVGMMHFDEAEFFTENTPQGINLRIVAAHEIGHAIGIGHSNVIGALMYPFYGGYVSVQEYKLPSDDLAAVRLLYGNETHPRDLDAPLTTTQTTTTKRTTTKRTRRIFRRFRQKASLALVAPCKPDSISIKSYFTGPENNLMVIVGRNELWEFQSVNKTWIKHELINKYPGLSKGVHGGVQYNGLTWFFKGAEVWAFKGYNLEPSYPNNIQQAWFPCSIP